MKKYLLLLFSLSLLLSKVNAQVTGSDTVCAGYIYTFDATVAGADSFVWTFPNGWAQISGTTTSHVEGLCTQNDGQVCVDAYGNGNFIGQYCHAVHWGSGGGGWYVQLGTLGLCQCPPNSATVVPNGTGGNCGGCGNGVLSPNLSYTIFDNPWPFGLFYWYADGSAFASPNVTTTFYVYLVDWTFTTPILIEGGLCPGSVQNSFTLSDCQYVNLGIQATPDPVCIGDTLTLNYDNQLWFLSTFYWNITQGNATLIPPTTGNSVQCIINSPGQVEVNLLAYDMNGCPYSGTFYPNYQLCNASAISGDSVVCAGYTYNYTATIPGAVSYTWTFPNGWYGISGQGTSSVSATCNLNAGNVCVEGFDANSVSLGVQCILTQWGNGAGQGWDVVPSVVSHCAAEGFSQSFSLVPNGSGSGNCPAGCGSGNQHANLIYGVYDDSSPYKKFVGVVGNLLNINPPLASHYYVFFVDTTLGADFPDAIEISGGCGSATVNNVITPQVVVPPPPAFTQLPDPACVGDTVLITQTDVFTATTGWIQGAGLTLLSNPTPEEALVVITGAGANIGYQGYNMIVGCPTFGSYTVNIVPCSAPVASFIVVNTPICAGTCTDFLNQSTNATTYSWSFPGGNPSTSTATNPTGICYSAPGNYDVTLIANGAAGSDTLVQASAITVWAFPPPQTIQQSGDTLIANDVFSTYQWYYNSVLIPGATESFYVATQSGNYNLISTDSNGCEVEAVILNVIADVLSTVDRGPLTIYPNPIVDFIEVQFGSDADEINELTVYNLLGEKIPLRWEKGNHGFRAETHSLISGMYLLDVSVMRSHFRTRFVKE